MAIPNNTDTSIIERLVEYRQALIEASENKRMIGPAKRKAYSEAYLLLDNHIPEINIYKKVRDLSAESKEKGLEHALKSLVTKREMELS